jgi:predicted enzyme related to lactoylglutathione lyase
MASSVPDPEPAARVTGIGGIFFKTDDPALLAQWYQEHLGVPVQGGSFAVFPWREAERPRDGMTVWGLFDRDSDYFGTDQSYMINYRVDDLDAVLTALRAEGVAVEDRVVEEDNGRFGWITDPQGHRIELWQPAP